MNDKRTTTTTGNARIVICLDVANIEEVRAWEALHVVTVEPEPEPTPEPAATPYGDEERPF